MSRVELAKIPALTFYQDSVTSSRRNKPIPQLVCVGKPCRLYEPEVVRCENLGGAGIDVDWKCEADLPESLRFGKVEVSCEGWSGPGDPYVLKGSCSLQYRLVQVPGVFRGTDSRNYENSFDWSTAVFFTFWVAFLALILYSFFQSCLRSSEIPRRRPQAPGPRPGWFPGGLDDDTTAPPPPYSKNSSTAASQGWAPGFWTGAALGGLGTHLFNTYRRYGPTEPRVTTWDWERPLNYGWRRAPPRDEDRGEGSSNLGSMRRSTGIGGSSVR